MHAVTEKHTWRTVELRYDNAFRTVYHECTLFRHVWNQAEIHVLDGGVEFLVIGIGAIELQLRLEAARCR